MRKSFQSTFLLQLFIHLLLQMQMKCISNDTYASPPCIKLQSGHLATSLMARSKHVHNRVNAPALIPKLLYAYDQLVYNWKYSFLKYQMTLQLHKQHSANACCCLPFLIFVW
ncbi:hypothetical protein CW304_15145 [Bacillus sp. UFRGS-B20]|nr:hypothetical protein CW304_15145 [Bacillus sp. UFRGS-B20]